MCSQVSPPRTRCHTMTTTNRRIPNVRSIAIMIPLAALLAACSAKEKAVEKQSPPTQQASAMATPAVPSLPPNHPSVTATTQTPAQTAERVPSNRGNLSGKVLETMNAGGYTYLKLRTASGDVWAAVRQTDVKVGSNIALDGQMALDQFESKTLNRKFDRIVFGTLAGGAAPAAAPSAPTTTQGAQRHMSVPADRTPIKVSRAEGGQTVGEVWAQKAQLSGKAVVIRGKVVKFLPEIMGRNWMHLRDGSGSPEKGDDDITVTTTDKAKVGDVITVRGTLHVDKDFGAGYRYPVIVEDAKISQ